MTVSHTYSTAGSYHVMLTIMDTNGASARATGTITVADNSNPAPSTPTSPPPGDGALQRSFSWRFEGRVLSLSISVPPELYDEAAAMPRSEWPNRSYDEYILSPADDSLLQTILQACRLDCYFRTIRNVFAFVQAGIVDQPGTTPFDYARYPVETLVDGVGDSEDTAILYTSLIRSMGYHALLAAVDTDHDGTADNMVVFVPVGDNYAKYGFSEAWRYEGMDYALAATGADMLLGSDPWGIASSDIKMLWNGSRLDPYAQLVKE